MKKILFLLIFSFSFLSLSVAQEICNDGIDNDGDGFIDCFDGDCASDSACDGFYMGNDASCEAEPSFFPVFSLSLGYQSANDVTNNLSRIAIGDLDRDGIPEILSQNKYSNQIFLLNGNDASTKYEASLENPEWRASMANVQNDNCGEVFLINNSGGFRLNSYDCELNLLWSSEVLPNDPAFVGHADFDGDGQPELYYKDEIRDAVTGTRIVKNAGVSWNSLPGGPVAVDIMGDDDLELVLGNKIYAVNLGNRTLDSGGLTLLATMPTTYNTKGNSYASGLSASTSIADYNLDGNLDVIVTGATGGNVSSVFLWDVTDNTVQTFNDPFGTGNYQFGWVRGMGRVNIADLDGDGQLNATFVSGQFLYALDENWDLLWRVDVNEETSGITGGTLFDFNGDGQSEVVYRDEDYLYIINGNDGSINTSIPCRSRTFIEYPIVADVDADGSSEICVVCTSEDFSPGTPGRELILDSPAEVRVYKSAAEPWVPSRRVWNQHAYFNVNINDDLSVPQKQQKHQLVWSDGICTAGPVRPLNNFLNQAPFLTSDGCYAYEAAELNLIDSSFIVNATNCLAEDFTVSFDFENTGDIAVSGQIPVTFYDGDPLLAGANKLNTELISVNVAVGETFSAEDITVNGTGANFILYAALNDNGSKTPTPITFPSTNFAECDYTNNIVSSVVNLSPFQISTEVSNNVLCSVEDNPNNGAVRAFYLLNGTEVTADYDFFWFNGTTLDATPDYTGAIYSGLSAGTYTVFASDKITGCSSDTVQVVINDTLRVITADITVDSGNSNCNTPNGQLTVQINGGEPVANFTYEWYEGNSIGGGLQISNGHIANGLPPATYTVLVTEIATGCTTIATIEVPDETVIPIVSASATDVVCSEPNSGAVSAMVEGETGTYTFEWFIGNSEKATVDYIGSSVSNLSAGSYTVRAIDSISNCESAPVTVEVNSQEIIADAGADIETCTDRVQLSASTNGLNGTGIWSFSSGPSGITAAPIFDNVGDTNTYFYIADSSVSGDYILQWTVTDGSCTAMDEITVTYELPPSAGAFNAAPEVNLTAEDSPFDLFGLLDAADAGGLWELTQFENDNGANPTLNTNTGVVDLSGASTGVYEFTYSVEGNLACAFDSETVSVVLVEPVSSETDIIGFSLVGESSPATIDSINHTVETRVVDTTDLSSLAPQIEVSAGASISPSKGETMDFNNPVIYTVTAEDGVTTQAWEVIVTQETSSETFSIIASISRPDGSPLEEGLAKLFRANGGLYKNTQFTSGELTFEGVEKGAYILQIIPLGANSSDIFSTYFTSTNFHKDASILTVENDLNLQMTMLAKSSRNSEGQGSVEGKVLLAKDSSQVIRTTVGILPTGEGIKEVLVYLVDKSSNQIYDGVVTDTTGGFALQSIVTGEYEIILDIPGIPQASTTVELPEDDQNLNLEITMYINSSGIVEVEISTILNVESPEVDFTVYPNPTTGIVFLSGYTGKEQDLSVFSASGSLVKKIALSASEDHKIDLRDLKNGIYYIQIEDGQRTFIKVIKTD